MTLEEKVKAIDEFCECKVCNECPIDNVCTNVLGDFEKYPTETEIAYALITADTCKNDPVEHPSHYTQGGIQCIDAMVAAFGREAVANFCVCNSFKYLFRHELKNGKQDIEKAEWYLSKYKELKYGDMA